MKFIFPQDCTDTIKLSLVMLKSLNLLFLKKLYTYSWSLVNVGHFMILSLGWEGG